MLKIFGEDAFYSCSVLKSDLTCQGWFDSSTVLKAKKLKFNFAIDDNGYVNFTRGLYRIVLTAKK